MAGSRREAVGSILKRLQGLLRSGAMKEDDRPIWYDVVKAIPPKPLPLPRPVQRILYPEDFVRVQFHKVYKYNGVTSLTDESHKSLSDRFVDTYMALHKEEAVPSQDLFAKTAQTLQVEGFRLIKHGMESSDKDKRISSQPQTQTPKLTPESILSDFDFDTDRIFPEKT